MLILFPVLLSTHMTQCVNMHIINNQLLTVAGCFGFNRVFKEIDIIL